MGTATRRELMTRLTGALLALALVCGATATAAHARSEGRSTPVLFLHGLDASGSAVDCGIFNPAMSAFRSWGWSGALISLAYYAGDHGCGDSISDHGSHSSIPPAIGGHSGGGHTANAPIEHLSQHFAWYVYDEFSRFGQPVDVFGYSMGGLILRDAVARTQLHVPGYPPYVIVEDAVTLGSPHLGAVLPCVATTECQEMLPGSPFLLTLTLIGQLPSGRGGTDWTVIGSDADGTVPGLSATGMLISHRARYASGMGISHDDLIFDTSDARDADVSAGTLVELPKSGMPHPVRWADFALALGSW